MATAVQRQPDAETTLNVPRYSWYALALLTVVYVLNFVDRTSKERETPPRKAVASPEVDAPHF